MLRTVTKVEFVNIDTPEREAVAHAIHGYLEHTKHGKRSGDHVVIHYDDGSTSQHILGEASRQGASYVVETPEGVEP
jgi:hypothetical protein